MLDRDRTRWHPIAASHDLPYRHVHQAQLLGREFAVWRADDDFVNIWENRCLHRGVRLSIGINDGRELKCQYHGWRYANRTAGCTYIPAHPADAPARTITNRTFPAVERHGLIWTAEEPSGEMRDIEGLPPEHPIVLRGIAVNAAADRVVERLKDYRFQPIGAIDDDEADVSVDRADGFSVALTARQGSLETHGTFFVQPVDSTRSVIRGVLADRPDSEASTAVLRHHSRRLSALRDSIEDAMKNQPSQAPIEPEFELLSPELAEMPEQASNSPGAVLRVQVARKWPAADGIAGFELCPIKGLLPTFQPGAHIDVHLPNNEVRQYSVVNGPGETDRYTIGVKLEAESKGGSRCMHEQVREGDLLAISEPRNNFPLRRDAVRTLLVAGGIGITPLLAMAQVLANQRLDYELHYFAQGDAQMAFRERLSGLGEAVHPHLGLDPAETAHELASLLARYAPGMHLYLCGPGPMLEAARRIAAETGWPDGDVHFEYFKNTNVIDDSSSFEIALARSCLTLEVPLGKSILEVLRENGVDMPSSCEEGACGTCQATVIEGEPDHQDVFLNDSEKRAGTKIMTCVSRAKSARLVLDL